jgi:hypothetical protein
MGVVSEYARLKYRLKYSSRPQRESFGFLSSDFSRISAFGFRICAFAADLPA